VYQAQTESIALNLHMFTYLSLAVAFVIVEIQAYFSFVVVVEKSEYTIAFGILLNHNITQSVAL
jgi:hypothetical protein